MTRAKVTMTRLNGRLGRKATNLDGVIGIITTGVATGSLTLGVIYPLTGIKDLEDLGVTAAYDTTNTTLIHHHISRLFFRNPSAEVHLMVLAQSVTLANMVDIANVNNAKKLLKDKNGRIKLLGVIRNPAAAYTPTLTTGLDADVITAVEKAKALVDEEAAEFRFVHVVVEGRSFNGTAGSALDLRTKTAPGVSVVIGADKDISAGNVLFNGYAAVGDFLGILSKCAVSQNPGEVIDEFNVYDQANGYFTNVALSSNLALESYSDASLTTLDTKGYIFFDRIAGLSGAWANDSHTCEVISSDYAYIENNRTINKMIELARFAILPKVKARLTVDDTTGVLVDGERSNLEDICEHALEAMKTDGDLSGGIQAYINPDINLLGGDTLDVELTAIPKAIGRAITVYVGFNNPF